MNIVTFPPAVISTIVDLLPQDGVINLALTNFAFYHVCLRKLYRRLSIQNDPVLNSRLHNNRNRFDFVDSTETAIYGLNDTLVPREGHQKMLEARLRALVLSLSINRELLTYVEEIYIEGGHSRGVEAAIAELLAMFEGLGLRKVYIADGALRQRLDYKGVVGRTHLSLVIVDSKEMWRGLRGDEEEVVLAWDSPFVGDVAITPRKVVIPPSNYSAVTETLAQMHRHSPFTWRPHTLTLCHGHGSVHPLPWLDPSQLKVLQVTAGCHDKTCCLECIDVFLHSLGPLRLSALHIVQTGQWNHAFNEKWDIVVLNFIKQVVDASDLQTLSVRHLVVADGICDDGFEGNYLRRVKLWGQILPNFLANCRHKINLYLPNLLSTLSVYEQAMNNLLWNGCKCGHCTQMLLVMDEFLMYHKYYHLSKHIHKDLVTTQLIRTVAEVLSRRLVGDDVSGDLQIGRPLRNIEWDYHRNWFSIPFKCLNYKNYEEAEFEDERDPHDEELYFDAEDGPNDCKCYHVQFYPDTTISMAHYVNDIVLKMINLNRGNAEDVEIGGIDDENDGTVSFRVNKLVVSGLVYTFDNEANGTAFYVNEFDELRGKEE